MNRVYLDYAATTPVDIRVVAVMAKCLGVDGCFGNPSSNLYSFGRDALDVVERARAEVATLVGCKTKDVVFTSGATEADNLAIKGVAASKSFTGRHVITMASEHKAVLMSCKSLERNGWEVSYLRPGRQGLLPIKDLRDSIRPSTALVSIMHVNNETGVIQDLPAIRDVVGETNALLHIDAAQSAGKIPIDWQSIGADLLSISAHKLYGPKGIGALCLSDKARSLLVSQMDGGGQEGGLRSGTLATHQIAGFGEACLVAALEWREDLAKVSDLRSRFLDRLGRTGGIINGNLASVYPGIVNISFPQIDSFVLLNALEDVAASAASACTTGTLEPSHVLRAMGIEGEPLYGAIRFSFGRFTTVEDIDFAAERVIEEIRRLGELAA